MEKLLRVGLFGWFVASLVAVGVMDYRFWKLERRQAALPEAAAKACNAELDKIRAEHDVIAARNRQLEAALRVIARDVDVAHTRIGDVAGSLDAVANTVPGRVRAPHIPKRSRPSPSGSNFLSERGPLETPDSTSVSGVVK
jgi:hypothetical protein